MDRSELGEPHVCRILVVDDEERVRVAVGRLLDVDGHRPVYAANGAAALDQLRSARPCLVLLDLRMPVLDGTGFVQALDRDPVIRDVPVVVVSANPETGPRDRPSLTKPFTFEQLRATVQQHRRCVLGS